MCLQLIWNAHNTREIVEIYDQSFSQIVLLSED